MSGRLSQKPLRAHPCALLSGHPWPPTFLGKPARHGWQTTLICPAIVSRVTVLDNPGLKLEALLFSWLSLRCSSAPVGTPSQKCAEPGMAEPKRSWMSLQRFLGGCSHRCSPRKTRLGSRLHGTTKNPIKPQNPISPESSCFFSSGVSR